MDDFKRTYQLKEAYYAINYHSPSKTEEEIEDLQLLTIELQRHFQHLI